jgi:biotin carboxyl carrier protein
MNGKLLDGKEKEEDVYEDALMEVTADKSEKVATAAVEEKTTPANAEVPGSKAEEANPEEGWQRVEGRTRRAPTPPLPPLEKPLEFGEFHLQIWGSIAHRADVLRMIGGPADVRWCAIRGTDENPSSRSFGMVLPLNKMVCTAAQAGKEKSWVVGAMWEDEDGVVRVTRYRLDLCGKAPTSWGRRGAPAAPEERQQQYGAALRGHANRAADVRAAWTQQQQFPPLPRQTAQQPELQELQAAEPVTVHALPDLSAIRLAEASADALEAGRGRVRLRLRGADLKVLVRSPRAAELSQHMLEKSPPDTSKYLLCPMPGLLVTLVVAVGDEVQEGQTLATVEAMKMENILKATRAGVVKAVKAAPGASLKVDDIILEFV